MLAFSFRELHQKAPLASAVQGRQAGGSPGGGGEEVQQLLSERTLLLHGLICPCGRSDLGKGDTSRALQPELDAPGPEIPNPYEWGEGNS